MFELLVSTTNFPLLAMEGSLTVDWPHPLQMELIREV